MTSLISRLDKEMRQVLAEMTLLSYGRASNWDPKSNGGKPGAVILRSRQIGRILHEYWSEVYADQRSDEGREETIKAAREELKNELVLRERLQGESEKEKRKRCIRDCKGLTVGEAAQMMRETTRWVIDSRKLACLDPGRGLPYPDLPDWREQARELRERGVSWREIGKRLGKPQSSVRDSLREAA